jgi:hypothetical protein
MAPLSAAQANHAVFWLLGWLLVFLVALLALSLAAVIASPSRTASPPAEDAGGESGPSGKEPPASPLPPSQVQYGGQVIDTSTGRTWRCPHNHPTPESATRCADFMEEQIKRLGWVKATGEHL